MKASDYWQTRHISRRRMLQGTAAASASVAIISACGGGNSSNSTSGTSAPKATTGAATTAPSAQASAQPVTGGTLSLMWGIADAQLDPHTSTEHFSAELWRAASHGLLKQAPDTLKPGPDLATSWETPDNLTYVFHLDPAAKWQNIAPLNGRAVTADDIVFSLKRISTPDSAHPRASSFSSIASFTATDPQTVTIKMKLPNVAILTPLSDKWTVMVAPEVVQQFGDLKRGASIIGCGPFVCKSADSSVGAQLVRNTSYWKPGLPYLDAVNYTTILDPAAQQAAFRAAKIDILANLPQLTLDSFKISGASTIQYVPVSYGMNINYIGGPVNKPPLNDDRVRQAINLAIDRDIMAGVAFPKYKYQNALLFSDPFWGIPADQAAKLPGLRSPKDADIKQATDLIKAAGVSGTTITIDTTQTYAPYFIDRAQAVQQMLQPIGLNIKLNVMEYAAMVNRQQNGSFQMGVGTYSAYGDPDTPLTNSFTTTGTRNYFKWSDSHYDDLVSQQRVETDLTKRQSLVREAQKYVGNGTPVSFDNWFLSFYDGYWNRVHNYQPNSVTQGWLLYQMWVAKS